MNTTNISIFLKKLEQQLSKSTAVLITSHRSPDDDSISAVLSLRYYLQHKYSDKKIDIIYESNFSSRWAVFPGFEQIKVTTDMGEVLKKYDTCICMDGNQYDRFTTQAQNLTNFSGLKICIDHHTSTPDPWDLALIQPQATSTSEVLYDLVYKKPDAELAKLLLLGILGDTGNLRYVSYKQSNIFTITKQLIEDAQVQIQAFRADYDYFTPTAIILAKELINHQQIVEIPDWPKAHFSYLGPDNLDKYSIVEIKEGVTLYLSTFNMIAHEVKWSLTFYPSPEGVKVSARSMSGSVNVRQLMEHFNLGSGHNFASGGLIANKTNPQFEMQHLLDQLPHISPMISTI